MARCSEHLPYRSHVCSVNFMIIDLLSGWEACLGNKMTYICIKDRRWSRNCVAWCLYSHELLYITRWSFELANSFSAQSLDFSLPCSRCVLHADRPGNNLQLFRTSYTLDETIWRPDLVSVLRRVSSTQSSMLRSLGLHHSTTRTTLHLPAKIILSVEPV